MSARILGAPRLLCPLCAIVILFAGPLSVAYAQSAGTADPVAPAVVSRSADGEAGQVELLVGHSTVLNVTAPIARVSLTRPEVADAIATSTQQLLIHGKAPGSITMFVWDRSGGIRRYEVRVQRDLSELERQLVQLFPGERINVVANGSAVVISGTVSSKYVIEKAAEVAAGYVDKRDDVVNLLRQGESTQSNQVLLRVRFAEVSRTAMTELGASFFSDGRDDVFGRTSTQQFQAPFFSEQDRILGRSLVFSDYLNLFLFDAKNQLGAVVRALQNRGLFQTLAEPNLIAQNGTEASFLAGGEYPYPAIQGSGTNLAVTIVFKEFGIRLNFTPTILGDEMIHLKVRPEVSSLDFTNAVTYQGFRVPSLSTRRAEAEIELQNGQTFAIAGLLNNSVTSSLQKVPGIGDIPILGMLFRSKAAQKAQTELVVMITPQILPRGSHGAATTVPGLVEPYLHAPPKVIPPPPPYVPDRRTDAPRPSTEAAGAAAGSPVETPVAAGQAGAAAAASREASAPPVPPPDPKELERQAKAERERQEAEARALAKRQEEERKLREAEEKRAAEEARRMAKLKQEQEKAEKKRAEEEAKRLAKLKKEQQEAEKKRAEQERKEQERLAREKAREEAKAAALRAEAEKQRQKEIREAEERLREAQAAYAAALGKTKPIK